MLPTHSTYCSEGLANAYPMSHENVKLMVSTQSTYRSEGVAIFSYPMRKSSWSNQPIQHMVRRGWPIYIYISHEKVKLWCYQPIQHIVQRGWRMYIPWPSQVDLTNTFNILFRGVGRLISNWCNTLVLTCILGVELVITLGPDLRSQAVFAAAHFQDPSKMCTCWRLVWDMGKMRDIYGFVMGDMFGGWATVRVGVLPMASWFNLWTAERRWLLSPTGSLLSMPTTNQVYMKTSTSLRVEEPRQEILMQLEFFIHLQSLMDMFGLEAKTPLFIFQEDQQMMLKWQKVMSLKKLKMNCQN